jgi:hypothetical protein
MRDAMPNPVRHTRLSAQFTIGGLYIVVQQASPMKLAESHSDVDRQAQEVVHLQGRAEQPLERLAAILEHQHGATAFSHELTRMHGPCPIQFILQSVFVS